MEYIEHAGTVLSLAYVILLMMNKVWAWPCGVAGSILIALTLFNAERPLYMETFSYIVYIVMGFYGWYHWVNGKKSNENELAIGEWKSWQHLMAITTTAIVGIGIGYLLSGTRAGSPYFDSLTTTFAMLGTWMQARKVLSNWVYWFFINMASVKLYWSNDFNSLPFLALVFTALSVSGFIQWLKIYRTQNA